MRFLMGADKVVSNWNTKTFLSRAKNLRIQLYPKKTKRKQASILSPVNLLTYLDANREARNQMPRGLPLMREREQRHGDYATEADTER